MQPAVFAKNHRRHLVAAAEVSAADAEQLITFRSSSPWKRADQLLGETGGRVPIYFGVVGGGPQALYRAWLREVVLKPKRDDRRSQEVLQFRPLTTADEDWWGESVEAFYVISGCHEMDVPIPYHALRKQSDGTPLSDDYNYSYALVTVTDIGALPPGYAAIDISAPPARVEAVVSRVIRDTALARRLKSLHDDRCQLCGLRLEFPSGQAYSEVHHLRPLGREHNGPDVEANAIVLCPNCHVLCDYKAVTFALEALRVAPGHEIGERFVRYHNQVTLTRSARSSRTVPGRKDGHEQRS